VSFYIEHGKNHQIIFFLLNIVVGTIFVIFLQGQ